MQSNIRRYDIDTIRVLALCLLIFYHIVVGFQPWSSSLYFIANKDDLTMLWNFMELINIWRIPILFVVSGMAVNFASKKRNLYELFVDRTYRIFLPLFFGMFFIVPAYSLIAQGYYDHDYTYSPSPGHLWFLGHIFVYVLLFSPVFYFCKNRSATVAARLIAVIIEKPFGVLALFSLPLILESITINPEFYAGFASYPIHGLITGGICFCSGFIFMSLDGKFWKGVKDIRLITFILAFSLYLIRIFEANQLSLNIVSSGLTAFEAACWMLSAFGFGAMYLNRPSKLLNYLTPAVYPLYIVHMPIQFLFSSLIFPLVIPAVPKLILLLLATYGGGLLIYEMVKKIKWARPLFGMKIYRDGY